MIPSINGIMQKMNQLRIWPGFLFILIMDYNGCICVMKETILSINRNLQDTDCAANTHRHVIGVLYCFLCTSTTLIHFPITPTTLASYFSKNSVLKSRNCAIAECNKVSE